MIKDYLSVFHVLIDVIYSERERGGLKTVSFEIDILLSSYNEYNWYTCVDLYNIVSCSYKSTFNC